MLIWRIRALILRLGILADTEFGMSTTALYQILVDLGAEKDQAREALETLACEDQVATKSDISAVKSDISAVRSDISELKLNLVKWMVSIAGVLFIALGFLIRLP